MARSLVVLASLLALIVPSAARAAPTLRDLVEMSYLSGLSVAPNERLAVVRSERPTVGGNRWVLDWWIVDTAGQASPRRVTGAGEALFTDAGTVLPERPQWSSDSRWFYYRALAAQGVQVWRASADGARVEQVTHDAADVIEFRLDPASLALTYRTGEPRDAIIAAEDAEYDRGVLVDRSIEPGQAIYHGMKINGRMASMRLSGDWFSRRGLLDNLPLHARRQDAAGRVEDLPPTPATTAPPPVLGRLMDEPTDLNAQGLTAFADRVDGQRVLALRDGGGAVRRCPDPACRTRRIVGLRWRGDEVMFIAAVPDGGHLLAAWRPDSGVRRILVYSGKLTGGDLLRDMCGFAGDRALCITEDAVDPARLEAVSLRGGARTTVFDPNALARSRAAMRIERLVWRVDDREFSGVLFLPDGVPQGTRTPLFIQYYSCDGYIRGGTGDEYPMPVMAAQGVTALCINAAAQVGVTRETYDALRTYDIAVDGIRAVIRRLDARGLIDPARVGIGGLSFGSEVVMRTLVKTDLIRAAAISSTEIEPIYYWFNHQQGPFFLKMLRSAWGLGAPDETPERWKEMSAALNAGAIDAPLLMQMPEQESRYNYELFGRLASRGVPVEMYVFPDEPHIKNQPRHKLAVYDRNLDWFRFWLAGLQDPDPAKAAQYRRWRDLQAAWDQTRKPAALQGAHKAPQPTTP